MGRHWSKSTSFQLEDEYVLGIYCMALWLHTGYWLSEGELTARQLTSSKWTDERVEEFVSTTPYPFCYILFSRSQSLGPSLRQRGLLKCHGYLRASQVALAVKKLPANAGAWDMGLIPGSGRSPGGGQDTEIIEGHLRGLPITIALYSCLLVDY